MTADKRRFWLLVQEPAPEVCVRHPGYEENLVATTDPEWLARWVLGELSLGQGLKSGAVEVAGPRGLVQTLARMGELAASALQHWGNQRQERDLRLADVLDYREGFRARRTPVAQLHPGSRRAAPTQPVSATV